MQFFGYNFIKTLFTQNKEIAEYTKTKWQKKLNPSNVSTDTTFLTFNNLTIGKTYRVTAKGFIQLDAGSVAQFRIYNGATEIDRIYFQNNTATSGMQHTAAVPKPFVATSTTLTAQSFNMSGGDLIFGGAESDTWVILEELPNHEVTTQWT